MEIENFYNHIHNSMVARKIYLWNQQKSGVRMQSTEIWSLEWRHITQQASINAQRDSVVPWLVRAWVRIPFAAVFADTLRIDISL